MGRGERSPKRRVSPPRRQSAGALPKAVRDSLPAGAASTWRTLAAHLPDALYLAGGTAAALRLHHRVSQDLDFFYHEQAVDLDALERELVPLGFAVTYRAPGTLKGLFGPTKVEFLHADEVRPQNRLEPPELVAGVRVAGLKDLMAMKLKVLVERGELRDYYDVMRIDEQSDISVEDGTALYVERYGIDRASDALGQLVHALGYLDDADEDESLPTSKAELTAWWRRRQAQVIRNLDW